MTCWVDLDHHWDIPCATVCIRLRQLHIESISVDGWKGVTPATKHCAVNLANAIKTIPEGSCKPEELARAVTDYIEHKRPDLTGVVLVQMTSRFGQLEVFAIHPNLKPQPEGCTPEQLVLD